nr:hypothetical protein [Marinicella sp. W31]MDC2879216.1 hypothetical protein [Marinicella sp. W31]
MVLLQIDDDEPQPAVIDKGRTCEMTVQTHLAALEEKHSALEKDCKT